LDSRCQSNCLDYGPLTVCPDRDCPCPPGQSLPASPNGGQFGKGETNHVCVPTALCVDTTAPECGNNGEPCGKCPCTPQCSGKQCGDEPDDGCGGYCIRMCSGQ